MLGWDRILLIIMSILTKMLVAAHLANQIRQVPYWWIENNYWKHCYCAIIK